MKGKVGDKFVLEIAEITKGAVSGKEKYRMKGFDSLYFDEKGLDKLYKYSNPTSFDIGDEVEYGGETYIIIDTSRTCEGKKIYDVYGKDGLRYILHDNISKIKPTGVHYTLLHDILTNYGR